MFLYLSKLLPPLVFPPGGNIVLLIAAWLLRKRRPRAATALFIFSIATLYAFSTPLLANLFVGHLENSYPDLSVQGAPQAQAIVVLGGGIRAAAGRHAEPEMSNDRLRMAMALYDAGKAPLIVFSGGNIGFLGGGRESEAVSAGRLMESLRIPASAILEEGASRNTRDNAVFTWKMLNPRGIRQILLVTSAMHMPRAAGLFRHAGFDVIAAPCDHLSGRGEPSLLFRFVPEPDNVAQVTNALREYTGLLVYRLRGWV